MHTQQTHPDKQQAMTSPEYSPAQSHELAVDRPRHGQSLMKGVSSNQMVITLAYRIFHERTDSDTYTSYAAEWLLDNYYVVQRAIRQVDEDMPSQFYAELPILAAPEPLRGYPRVYVLAAHILEENEAGINPNALAHAIEGYQEIAPLTIGELWAMPTMLRLGLISCLSRALAREAHIPWPEEEMANELVQFPDALSDADIIANAIQSLHALDSQDWADFFEDTSLVERMLRTDPAECYPRMDFETRDAYRDSVQELAAGSNCDELGVAEQAVRLAKLSRIHGHPALREHHVGYYLMDKGRKALERQLGYRMPRRQRLSRRLSAQPTALYLGSISLTTVLLLVAVGLYAWRIETGFAWLLVILAATLLPLISIAVSLVNSLVTRLSSPSLLPKLDFSTGVPASSRTMIVVPALLTSESEVDELLQQAEQHYLGSMNAYIDVGLLTDFADAPEATMPEDEGFVARARKGIEGLNQRYGSDAHQPFYFFHRERHWNPAEGVWMGWERKRGKLEEFNRLLRGDRNTSYTVCVGRLETLSDIRYVITLDADTKLPPGSAQRLIGSLAHPLNRAQLDSETGKVISGYTILQPRTEINPVAANQTLFSRIFSGDTGIDLYTLAVSDIYQDLFGEGIFVGKGIYDVDAFMQTLEDRIPENSLLSHDLFEGIHGRTGLVSDIVVYEDYPSSYLVQARRLHRWIRGDWQLLPWLGRTVPHAVDGRTHSVLSTIDRWKILDNLRRSLLMPAILLLLVLAWFWLPGSPLVWTALAIAPLLLPLLTTLIAWLEAGLADSDWSGLGLSLRFPVMRAMLNIAFLPHAAYLAVDAGIRTLLRVYGTRRRLLQWTTAAQTARIFQRRNDALSAWGQMIGSCIMAIALALAVIGLNPSALPVASPFLLAWFLAPQIAYWVSQAPDRSNDELNEAERQKLRNLARRTWLYFEQYVGPEDNWLPPDHVQVEPLGVVAHRTSPTNIGVLLVSAVAAHDFGYESLMSTAVRLHNTFETLAEMERHQGHFLNWYDTRTLDPLPPRYVSMVDNGNLAGCMVALGQSLEEMPAQPVLRWARWQGLLDTLGNLADEIENLEASPLETVEALCYSLQDVEGEILAVQEDHNQWIPALQRLLEYQMPALLKQLRILVSTDGRRIQPDTLHRMRIYLERVHHQTNDMQREIDTLAPWLQLFTKTPSTLSARINETPALKEQWQSLRSILSPTLTVGDTVAACAEAVPLAEGLALDLGECTRPGDTFAQATATHASATQLAAEAVPQDDCRETDTVAMWFSQLIAAIKAAEQSAADVLNSLAAVKSQAEVYIDEMDFGLLYNQQRDVFHIGFNVDSGSLDDNYYDLLASEARIGSLVAIAKHDVPFKHWLHLGRPLTMISGRRTLLSWSGTMFEYLMPPLFMRSPENTLLRQTEECVVDYQIAYGRTRGLPWGVSESGYYHFDANMFYQYQAFGVPGLGFKRGLGDQRVITPYASLLALNVRPRAVLQNLSKLAELGMLGDYGLYEAIDFTESRLPMAKSQAIVRSFMVHHQGMILLALLNHLQDNLMVERFHADSRIRNVEMLLQEQIPHHSPLEELGDDDSAAQPVQKTRITAVPWHLSVATPTPQLHHLSNGRYGVLITNAGTGFSRWQEIDLTRWRADATCDDWGSWLYLHDEDTGATWSITGQPIDDPSVVHEVTFAPHFAAFTAHRDDLAARMEIRVAPEDDVEVRQIHLTNQSDSPRRLTLTGYGELVLGDQRNDRRHPAFNKLFIESEYEEQSGALVFRRRPRSADEEPIYLAHTVVFKDDVDSVRHYETDRARFIGRLQTIHAPNAMTGNGMDAKAVSLSATTGNTLDPIMAIGQQIELKAHATLELAYITAVGRSRYDVVDLVRRYDGWEAIPRVATQARTQAELELRQLGLDSETLACVQQMLSALIYPAPALRADVETLAANRLGQPSLWPHAISGDYPILLIRIADDDGLPLVRDVLRAHHYWRDRNLHISLVILNQESTGYAQELQGSLARLLDGNGHGDWLNRRGGIFVLRADDLGAQATTLIETAARVILDQNGGSLPDQLAALHQRPSTLPYFVPSDRDRPALSVPPLERPDDLLFDNGIGGFSPDGCEYVIYLESDRPTPAPWSNVIANPDFGFLMTESGSSFTWAANSGENRLTPWSNDPVSDPSGEALYLRDEETGDVWSPTVLPAGDGAPVLVRHGAGYSVYTHHSPGLKEEMRAFAVIDAPLKIVTLRLENTTQHGRRITATYYAEWVLGVNRDEMQQYVVPAYDDETGALLAHNAYNTEFSERIAFLASSEAPHSLTTNRTEFLGRHGRRRQPVGLKRIGLEGTVEAGVDPCAAYQVHLDLEPDEVVEVHFLLGQGEDWDAAYEYVKRYRDPDQIAKAWQEMTAHWDDLLGTIQVETPEPAMDLLLNRWLLYQNLSCRVWGRSAFYQSSGAYGFRDQLQDVMALVYSRPELAREQILRAAAHQFEAGDVLHWWHPPSGRGVRTRITDDLLWLPYVSAFYVTVTGDHMILDEELPFLVGKPLDPDEEERYGEYDVTGKRYTLYTHCLRAIDRGTTSGPHGLPLMGAGDWNDGMNRVGIGGRGESVWLAWFLSETLTRFAALCDTKDAARTDRFRRKARNLRETVDEEAWDGDWYLRAFYDDGTPLGSSQNRECSVDSIAQSWAVFAADEPSERARQAMQSVAERLVDKEKGLIRLFTPPFDHTSKDPGYIKGYPPGVRENGGQYTHAALWSVWAFAELGDGDRAVELFQLINPILHGNSPEETAKYCVEPYVVAADIYDAPAHPGRGGWTWYTGSAGWMYRLGIEGVLGLQRHGDRLRLQPHVPARWQGFRVTLRHGHTCYRIRVEKGKDSAQDVEFVEVDGVRQESNEIHLVDDGESHDVHVLLRHRQAEGPHS